jgi:hypothetical protein
MEIQIKIGREETDANAITVPSACKKVSRHHAKLAWKDGAMAIEDNESANGTYVNGKRIAKTKVTENDTVWLGGVGDEGCYQVDIKKAFSSCREAEGKLRTDYSKEFEVIKQAYIDYQREVTELKKKATQQSQMPKLLASLVPAVVGLIILLVSNDMTLRIVSMSVGSVLSGVVGILTMGKSSSTNEKMSEGITELQIKYQPRYCCPKCGMKYPFTTHWKRIEADGKCPNPRCDAQFVK